MVNIVKFIVLGALCIVAANAACAEPSDCDKCSLATTDCLACADKDNNFKTCIDLDPAEHSDGPKKEAACAAPTVAGAGGKVFAGDCLPPPAECKVGKTDCDGCAQSGAECKFCVDDKGGFSTCSKDACAKPANEKVNDDKKNFKCQPTTPNVDPCDNNQDCHACTGDKKNMCSVCLDDKDKFVKCVAETGGPAACKAEPKKGNKVADKTFDCCTTLDCTGCQGKTAECTMCATSESDANFKACVVNSDDLEATKKASCKTAGGGFNAGVSCTAGAVTPATDECSTHDEKKNCNTCIDDKTNNCAACLNDNKFTKCITKTNKCDGDAAPVEECPAKEGGSSAALTSVGLAGSLAIALATLT